MKCKRCFTDSWSLTTLGGYMTATCNGCGTSFEFEAKEKVVQKEDEPCRKCGGKIVWNSRKLTAKRLKKAYHYEKWLKCLNCRTVYFDDKYKVNH